jgi:hypothetical protein
VSQNILVMIEPINNNNINKICFIVVLFCFNFEWGLHYSKSGLKSLLFSKLDSTVGNLDVEGLGVASGDSTE